MINEEILSRTISVMENICKFSTQKYIATHMLNKNFIDEDIFFRLSVHAKQNRKDIPTIYLLGINGKNQLSQHCSMLLKNNGKTEFITNYEAKLINCKKIIASNNSEVFNLSKNNVLFYAEENINIVKAIELIKFISI